MPALLQPHTHTPARNGMHRQDQHHTRKCMWTYASPKPQETSCPLAGTRKAIIRRCTDRIGGFFRKQKGSSCAELLVR